MREAEVITITVNGNVESIDSPKDVPLSVSKILSLPTDLIFSTTNFIDDADINCPFLIFIGSLVLEA